MRTKRFDFNFKPLRIITSFGVDGSVPGRQTYDGNTDGFIPDYSLTSLKLRLSVSRQDKDEALPHGEINNLLTNVTFTQILDGVATTITSSTSGYSITTSGNDAGTILVSKNINPLHPITIRVEADYLDTRLNQVHHIMESFLILCDNSTEVVPEVEVDIDDQSVWDPYSDPDSVTITAGLRVGKSLAAYDSHLLFKWLKLRSDGSFTEVGTDDTEDYDMTVGSDTCHKTLTVDRRLMGSETEIKCVALYNKDGSASGMSISTTSPVRCISIARRIPKFEDDFTGVPLNIPPGSLYLNPTAVLRDTKGIISNPEREVHFIWKGATNQASGSLTYTQIGYGVSPTLPTKKIVSDLGMVLGLDVVDAGPVAALEDSDGYLIEDSDGALILVQ